jgi:hypothetical protein
LEDWDWVLKLMKTVYGSRQGAKKFWIKALKVMDALEFNGSNVIPPTLGLQTRQRQGSRLVLGRNPPSGPNGYRLHDHG